MVTIGEHKTMATPKGKRAGGGAREPRKITKPIHLTRLNNLKGLIDKRFDGNATAMGRAIERTHTFMWQLVNEHRAIGEDTARHIEVKLGLAPGAMDQGELGARTDVLIANVGDGIARTFRMTPRRELNKFSEKPIEWRPFPKEGASEHVFFSTIINESIDGFKVGDLAFSDQADTELKQGCIYVITFKMKTSKAAILCAKEKSDGSFSFVSTFVGGLKETYDRNAVRVVARVVSIVREF